MKTKGLTIPSNILINLDRIKQKNEKNKTERFFY